MEYTLDVNAIPMDNLQAVADAVHKRVHVEKKEGKHTGAFNRLMKFNQESIIFFMIENKGRCTFGIPDSNTKNITHLRFPFGITSWSEYERTNFVAIINEEALKLL